MLYRHRYVQYTPGMGTQHHTGMWLGKTVPLRTTNRSLLANPGLADRVERTTRPDLKDFVEPQPSTGPTLNRYSGQDPDYGPYRKRDYMD